MYAAIKRHFCFLPEPPQSGTEAATCLQPVIQRADNLRPCPNGINDEAQVTRPKTLAGDDDTP